ncbi:hypothetical protein [Microbulbifer discodermiae]|uniref:hypothetical protein n=1 Tax=Microbulbifer sp. 2201CG32-9 TaxID=3232309 RepID=UPI00345BB1A0
MLKISTLLVTAVFCFFAVTTMSAEVSTYASDHNIVTTEQIISYSDPVVSGGGSCIEYLCEGAYTCGGHLSGTTYCPSGLCGK